MSAPKWEEGGRETPDTPEGRKGGHKGVNWRHFEMGMNRKKGPLLWLQNDSEYMSFEWAQRSESGGEVQWGGGAAQVPKKNAICEGSIEAGGEMLGSSERS